MYRKSSIHQLVVVEWCCDNWQPHSSHLCIQPDYKPDLIRRKIWVGLKVVVNVTMPRNLIQSIHVRMRTQKLMRQKTNGGVFSKSREYEQSSRLCLHARHPQAERL